MTKSKNDILKENYDKLNKNNQELPIQENDNTAN